jgi:ribonuclease-3
MDKERQASLSRIIHYTFNDSAFMIMALTHRSFSAQHNERLEFLGDSVLSFLIAEELYKRFPRIDEGDLSRLRAQLVKESSLSAIATSIGLGDFIRLGEGELNEIDPKLIQKDPKTLLQELLQSKKSDLPIYTVVSIEGEAHSQTFTIECIIKKSDIKTQGIGNSRRIAEQEAAAKAYQLMLGII